MRSPPRHGHGIVPESSAADYSNLSLRDFREKVTRSFKDLESRFDQLAISDSHRRLSGLEVRMARVEGFEGWLLFWEDRAAATYNLECLQLSTEHQLELLRQEVEGIGAVAGTLGFVIKIVALMKKGEDASAAEVEYQRQGREMENLFCYQIQDRHDRPAP